MQLVIVIIVLISLQLISHSEAFTGFTHQMAVTGRNSHSLPHRQPLFSKEDNAEETKKGFTFAGLVQLIAMGAGAPGLGEYKGTDESGRMLFELEANNLVDSDGEVRQTKGKFFNEGYVESDFKTKPPGFWQNLVSGGKLQEEWDAENR
mmetsp:Transcript_24744/g.41249  ORF Transcript_24744/g.41249 Transcript_24744/m.41249 type:complete len:149 (-) Transcript_24744:619-1065(-)